MLVDFSCAFLIFFTLKSTEYFAVFVFIYNFCAFAMQMPLGILADRWNHNSIVAALGCGLIAIAYLFSIPVCIATAAGLGNALFHLGGGIDTMNASVKKLLPLVSLYRPVHLVCILGPCLVIRKTWRFYYGWYLFYCYLWGFLF